MPSPSILYPPWPQRIKCVQTNAEPVQQRQHGFSCPKSATLTCHTILAQCLASLSSFSKQESPIPAPSRPSMNVCPCSRPSRIADPAPYCQDHCGKCIKQFRFPFHPNQQISIWFFLFSSNHASGQTVFLFINHVSNHAWSRLYSVFVVHICDLLSICNGYNYVFFVVLGFS